MIIITEATQKLAKASIHKTLVIQISESNDLYFFYLDYYKTELNQTPNSNNLYFFSTRIIVKQS